VAVPIYLTEILTGLNSAGIRYVVVGGVAATIHGSPRITADVDICYDPTADNREALAALLRRWNAYLRGAGRGLPWILDARTLRDSSVITLVTDLGDMDVMQEVAGIGSYAKVEAASVPMTFFGVSFRVVALDALIAAKKAAGRRKDQEALLELEALREELRKRGHG